MDALDLITIVAWAFNVAGPDLGRGYPAPHE
jgi:hypothetical protein